MKNFKIIMISFMFTLILPIANAKASTSLAQTLKGRILIQAEQLGEAWYINPLTSTRYSLGRPAEALAIMKKLGVGMTTANINRIAQIGFNDVDKAFAQKYAGLIILQVEDSGQAWYVNPLDLKKYYLGKPIDALSVMKDLGLGITRENLMKIPLSNGSSANENPKILKIAINRTQFTPINLEIVRGDTITWTNRDTITHKLASSNSSLTGFGSNTLISGKSYSYTFNNSGIYYYNGMLDSDLMGMIVVR
ncbi:MAG: hypothetical protein WCG01_03810 [bacterium]